ncbi:hypothetical protein, partial [Oenococcus oeni]|uniref:hypothetical protein n=1 Tax=Oenococcus oeni TaxID=1247 RepID=UPI001C5AF52B
IKTVPKDKLLKTNPDEQLSNNKISLPNKLKTLFIIINPKKRHPKGVFICSACRIKTELILV